jgi:hypothetical protein
MAESVIISGEGVGGQLFLTFLVWSGRAFFGDLNHLNPAAVFVHHFMPQMHGGRSTVPPATPRKSVLINVACGDLLEAEHSGEEGRRGYRNERAGARRGRLPSGARSSQPLAGGQVAWADSHQVGVKRNRKDAEALRRREEIISLCYSLRSLRLCDLCG